MYANTGRSQAVVLERLVDIRQHVFSNPLKKIDDGDGLQFFFTSTAYRDLSQWLHQLNRAVFPTKNTNGTVTVFDVGSVIDVSNSVQNLKQLLTSLSDLIHEAPPDTGPRRFGNVAFRKWYQLTQESATGLIKTHLGHVLTPFEDDANVVEELRVYLLGGFGSAQRLDYGTGHELSFLAFLGCLWKLNAFEDGEESAIVLEVVQPYLDLIRKLIMTYTLEPAGSHGVWGLDDHSFVPYIFGSAQLGPAIRPEDRSSVPVEGSIDSAPSPSSVTSRPTVSEFKNTNMYFSAINFIYEVKKGPFWEHSPVLYDVSGIKDGWAKINKGMMKMYAAEVLGKFPVVQHFPFGSMFKWETDANAIHAPSSIHAQQQPTATQSKDVPPVVPNRTTAPWARAGTGVTTTVPLPTHTGLPSTRAPWAATSRPVSSAARASGAPGSTAPWSRSGNSDKRGSDGMPPSTFTPQTKR